MSKPGFALHRWNDVPKQDLSAHVSRRVIGSHRKMVAQLHIRTGGIVPREQHEHEQLTCVLEGSLRFRLGEHGADEVVMGPGDVLHIGSWVWHEAEALADTTVVVL